MWPSALRLMPLVAPWHPAGREEGWETAKWLSYGPNVLSTSKAQRAGFDDALLLSRKPGWFGFSSDLEEAYVLDGPNFAVGWFRHDRFELPGASVCTPPPHCVERCYVSRGCTGRTHDHSSCRQPSRAYSLEAERAARVDDSDARDTRG